MEIPLGIALLACCTVACGSEERGGSESDTLPEVGLEIIGDTGSTDGALDVAAAADAPGTDAENADLDAGDSSPTDLASAELPEVHDVVEETALEDIVAELPMDTGSEAETIDEGITVLFIGNSYTFGNDLPGLVEDWAEDAGVDLTTEMIAKGGALLEQHAADAETLATIAELAPTFVVLQEQSYVPVIAPFTFYTGAEPLADATHAVGGTPVFFETWARQEGHALYDNELSGHDPASMQSALRQAYKTAALNNEGLYAPVGDAWEMSLSQHPELTLHSGDGSHAALSGSYLAAAIFVTLLADVTVDGETNTWSPPGLDAVEAGLLRQAANDTLTAP